jgi:hypothetical protein
MTEIYKLVDYDLLDIRLGESLSKLELSLIWSDYDESRVTVELKSLVYLRLGKIEADFKKQRYIFPFFVENLTIYETRDINLLTSFMDARTLSECEKEMRNFYYLKLQCVELDMDAVGFNVVINDKEGLTMFGIMSD